MGDADILRATLDDDAAADAALRDPQVQAALRAGGGVAVHDALWKFRGKPPSRAHRAVLDRTLARRRLFQDPLKGAPTMHTINGVGTRLVGAAEPDPRDGGYVSTLFFTFLFVPVFPLTSYLVSDAPETKGFLSGGRRTWSFRAKVPLSPAHRRWRVGAFAALAAGALAAAFAVLHRKTHSDVRLLNGLDDPVDVTIGAYATTLPPRGIETKSFDAGRAHVVARIGGRTVEEIDVEVPSGSDCVAYNVLGAAPAFDEGVVYSVHDAKVASPPPFVVLAGESWLVRSGVDDAFEKPPREVSFSRSDKAVKVRRHVDVAEGGWRAAAQMASESGDAKRAAAIARRAAEAEPGRADAQSTACGFLAAADDVAGAVDLAAKRVAREPTSIEAHRLYQSQMMLAGRVAEAREVYRAAYEKDPGSPSAAYLHARLSPFSVALPVLERAVAAHPEFEPLHRNLVYVYFHLRRFADAAKHFDGLSTEDRTTYASLRVRALAALGRTVDARRVAAESGSKGDPWFAFALGALDRAPGAPKSPFDAAALAQQWGATTMPLPAWRAIVAAQTLDRAGFDRDKNAIDDAGEKARAGLRLIVALDPAFAAAGTKDDSLAVAMGLDVGARLALICELHGAGREATARKLFEGLDADGGITFDVVEALPKRTWREDLDLALQAVLEAAAARRTMNAGERARLLEAARADDVLGFVVPR